MNIVNCKFDFPRLKHFKLVGRIEGNKLCLGLKIRKFSLGRPLCILGPGAKRPSYVTGRQTDNLKSVTNSKQNFRSTVFMGIACANTAYRRGKYLLATVSGLSKWPPPPQIYQRYIMTETNTRCSCFSCLGLQTYCSLDLLSQDSLYFSLHESVRGNCNRWKVNYVNLCPT